jgi:hypothetical protein
MVSKVMCEVLGAAAVPIATTTEPVLLSVALDVQVAAKSQTPPLFVAFQPP